MIEILQHFFNPGDLLGKLLACMSLLPMVILVGFGTLIAFRRDLHTVSWSIQEKYFPTDLKFCPWDNSSYISPISFQYWLCSAVWIIFYMADLVLYWYTAEWRVQFRAETYHTRAETKKRYRFQLILFLTITGIHHCIETWITGKIPNFLETFFE